jgi:ABC-type branched-subunit amino acid transport system permease subunit
VTTLAQDLYLLVAAYGLAVAVTYAGLPVLGQSAFVAVGAFGTTQLVMHGTPLGVAVVVAVAAAALAGYAIGFAAARLDGGPLALATWALAWLAYTALVVFPRLGGGAQGLTRPSPARLVSPTLGLTAVLSPWVHVAVATAVAAVVALVLWRSDRLAWGLDLAALRSGPVLAESLGVPVRRRRCAILAVAAALGALGGAGTAVLLGVWRLRTTRRCCRCSCSSRFWWAAPPRGGGRPSVSPRSRRCPPSRTTWRPRSTSTRSAPAPS